MRWGWPVGVDVVAAVVPRPKKNMRPKHPPGTCFPRFLRLARQLTELAVFVPHFLRPPRLPVCHKSPEKGAFVAMDVGSDHRGCLGRPVGSGRRRDIRRASVGRDWRVRAEVLPFSSTCLACRGLVGGSVAQVHRPRVWRAGDARLRLLVGRMRSPCVERRREHGSDNCELDAKLLRLLGALSAGGRLGTLRPRDGSYRSATCGVNQFRDSHRSGSERRSRAHDDAAGQTTPGVGRRVEWRRRRLRGDTSRRLGVRQREMRHGARPD